MVLYRSPVASSSLARSAVTNGPEVAADPTAAAGPTPFAAATEQLAQALGSEDAASQGIDAAALSKPDDLAAKVFTAAESLVAHVRRSPVVYVLLDGNAAGAFPVRPGLLGSDDSTFGVSVHRRLMWVAPRCAAGYATAGSFGARPRCGGRGRARQRRGPCGGRGCSFHEPLEEQVSCTSPPAVLVRSHPDLMDAWLPGPCTHDPLLACSLRPGTGQRRPQAPLRRAWCLPWRAGAPGTWPPQPPLLRPWCRSRTPLGSGSRPLTRCPARRSWRPQRRPAQAAQPVAHRRPQARWCSSCRASAAEVRCVGTSSACMPYSARCWASAASTCRSEWLPWPSR